MINLTLLRSTNSNHVLTNDGIKGLVNLKELHIYNRNITGYAFKNLLNLKRLVVCGQVKISNDMKNELLNRGVYISGPGYIS